LARKSIHRNTAAERLELAKVAGVAAAVGIVGGEENGRPQVPLDDFGVAVPEADAGSHAVEVADIVDPSRVGCRADGERAEVVAEFIAAAEVVLVDVDVSQGGVLDLAGLVDGRAESL